MSALEICLPFQTDPFHDVREGDEITFTVTAHVPHVTVEKVDVTTFGDAAPRTADGLRRLGLTAFAVTGLRSIRTPR